MPISDEVQRSENVSLFDHFVGEREQRRRNGETESTIERLVDPDSGAVTFLPAYPANDQTSDPPKRSKSAERRPKALRQKKASYSITSSAVASNDCGTFKPSVLAALRLITNSNFVASWTGRSPGFSPFNMRST